MPPAGVSRGALYGAVVDLAGEDKAKAFWKWLTVEQPDWGREGWARLAKARANCPKATP